MMLEVAALLPDVKFEVAGTPESSGTYSRRLFARAGTLANVSMCGVIPRHQMAAFYRGAVALLCTSEYEGFPNTFLEAWSLGVPVVSTVEPDELLSAGGLGFTGQTAPELVAALKRLGQDQALWQTVSAKCLRYFRENHTIESSMPQFERLLESAAASARPAQLAYR
jgi:glycosyltransferase involved in cell wall biosynthesis